MEKNPKETLATDNTDPAVIVDAVFERASQGMVSTSVEELDGLSDEGFAQYFGFEPGLLTSNGIVSVEKSGPVENNMHNYLYARRYVNTEGEPVARVLTLTRYGMGTVAQTHLIWAGGDRLFGTHVYDASEVNDERSLFNYVRWAMNIGVPSERKIANQISAAVTAYEADPHDELMIAVALKRDEDFPEGNLVDWFSDRSTIDFERLTDISEEEMLEADADIRDDIVEEYSDKWRTLDRLDSLWQEMSSSRPYRITPAVFQEAVELFDNNIPV